MAQVTKIADIQKNIEIWRKNTKGNYKIGTRDDQIKILRMNVSEAKEAGFSFEELGLEPDEIAMIQSESE